MEDIARAILHLAEHGGRTAAICAPQVQAPAQDDHYPVTYTQRRVRRDEVMRRTYHLEEKTLAEPDHPPASRPVDVTPFRVLATFDSADAALACLAADLPTATRRAEPACFALHVDGARVCAFRRAAAAARALRSVRLRPPAAERASSPRDATT